MAKIVLDWRAVVAEAHARLFSCDTRAGRHVLAGPHLTWIELAEAGRPYFEYAIENTTNCEIKAFRIDESLPMFQAAICGAPTAKVVPPGPPTWGDWWGTLRPNEVAKCSSLYITPNVQFNIINNIQVDSKW